ncbi:MAG: TadE/TadG family type IV pilus assembly protein [Planctomycetota bacterium]
MPNQNFADKRLPHRLVGPRREGKVVVEMALVSTVLFGTLFGGMELSRVASLRHSADYAAYVGARAGIVSGATVGQVRRATREHLNNLGISKAKISVSPSAITEDTDTVSVSVDIPMKHNGWAIPTYFLGRVGGRATLLTERSSMAMGKNLPTRPAPPPPPGGSSPPKSSPIPSSPPPKTSPTPAPKPSGPPPPPPPPPRFRT